MADNTKLSDDDFRVAKIDEYLADLREQLLANSHVHTDKSGLRHAYLYKHGSELVVVSPDVLEITAPMPGSTIIEIISDEDGGSVRVEERPPEAATS